MEIATGHDATVTETKRPRDDPFFEMLPLLLSDAGSEQQEPGFDELDKPTKARYLQLMEQRYHLAEQGELPTGTDVAIFVSNVGTSDEVSSVIDADGNESFLVTYEVSEAETEEHMAAARGIAYRIKTITGGVVQTNIQIATRETLDEAVANSEVAHIIFIGHANSSLLAIGPEEDYTWGDPPQALDHLKLSFGVFGCGIQRPQPQPRVGSSLTAPSGILYGIGKAYFDEGTPYDFDQLVALPNGALEGTPSLK